MSGGYACANDAVRCVKGKTRAPLVMRCLAGGLAFMKVAGRAMGSWERVGTWTTTTFMAELPLERVCARMQPVLRRWDFAGGGVA
jgi:hypothetical protein